MNAPSILMLLDNPFESDSRVSKEIEVLHENGFKTIIVCLQKKGLPRESESELMLVLRWIDEIYLRPFHPSYSSSLAKLADEVSKLDFNIIHCNDMFLLPLAREIIKRNKLKPLVYDTHEYFKGLDYNKSNVSISSKIKGFFVWKYFLHVEKLMSKRAALILCPSEPIAAKLQQLFKTKRTPLVVRNIPSKRFFTNNLNKLNDIRSQCKIPKSHLVMVQSGNVYQSLSELRTIFDLVVQFADLHFVLINNRKIAHEIKIMIGQNLDWKSRIHVIPFEEDKLYEQLSSADFGLVFVNSKMWESQYLTSPNRCFEYSLAALPFLSNPQSTSEYLKSRFGHVIVFDQLTDFKSALTKMIDGLTEFKSNAKKGSKAFSWEEEFAPVIEELNHLTIENNSK